MRVEDLSQLTALEAKDKIKQTKEIFSSKCLEIFAAMADSVKDGETFRNHSRNNEVTKIENHSESIQEKPATIKNIVAEKEIKIQKLSGIIREKGDSFQQLIKEKEAEMYSSGYPGNE